MQFVFLFVFVFIFKLLAEWFDCSALYFVELNFAIANIVLALYSSISRTIIDNMLCTIIDSSSSSSSKNLYQFTIIVIIMIF
jgi:hypothetical protein